MMIVIGNQSQKTIIETLQELKQCNYKQLKEITKIPESTLFRNLNQLIKDQIVTIQDTTRLSNNGGPDARIYVLNNSIDEARKRSI